MKKVYLLLIILFSLFNGFATDYYSQGTNTFNTLGNWNTLSGGGGSSPANFNTANDVFIIQNGHTITTSATIAFNATGSKIQIQSGGILTATHLFTTLAIFQVDNGGTYNHNAAGSVANGVSTDFPGTTGAGRVFGATSNVNINAWAQAAGTPVSFPTIAAPGWGNLNINVPTWAGSMNMTGAFTAVQGNLDINSTGGTTREFRLNGTTLTNTTTIGGNLTINGGILGITSGSNSLAQVLNIGGNLIVNTGTGQIANSSSNSNVAINVTGAIIISGGATPAIASSTGTTYTVGNGISVSAGTFSLGTSSSHVTTVNVTGDISVTGTGAITNTSSSNNTVTCTGNFNLSGTGLYQMQNSSSASKTHVFNIGGNFNMTGGTFTGGSNSSTGKVNFTGGAASVTYTQSGGTITPSKNTDWTIAVSKTVTLNNDFVYPSSSVVTTFAVNGTLNCATNNLTGSNNFVLGATGTLKIGSAAGISSTAATGSIQLAGTRTFPTTANYEYNGSASQVTGNQLPATVNKLTINNGTGVSLTSGVSAGTLEFTLGKLTLGANNVVANTITGSTAARYVITDAAGVLKINAVGASNILFPVGPSASGYNPITINNAGAVDNFSVKVKPTFTNAPFDPTKAVNMEWTVSKDGSASGNNVSLTPQWNLSDEPGTFNRAGSLVIGHYGAIWDETAATLGGSGPYTATASGFTSFSPFTVGEAGSFFNATPPSVLLSSPNPSVAAGNVGQGLNKNLIYQFNLGVTVNAAILNTVNFTTGGTYVATDVTKYQIWYNTTNNFNTASQIGTDITTGLGAGSHSFGSLGQGIGSGVTGYFWVTADIAVSGVSTPGNTINVSAITNANILFASANQSGTAFASDDQTIVAPSLTLTSANPSVVSGSIGQGVVKATIYNFTVAAANADAILNQLSFTTAGTYVAADITKFQVWYNNTNNLGTALQLGADITASLGIGAHSILSLTQGIANGVTGYFWVTADIAGAATLGNTLNVAAITSGDLIFASGSMSGTAFAGGVQTIITPSLTTDDFRSKASGDWADITKWESAPFGSGIWHDATLPPTSAATTVLIQGGHTISINSAVTSTNTTIDNLGEVDILLGGTLSFGTTKTITINGTLKQVGTLTMGTSTFAIGATGVYENAVPATTTGILIPTATPWTAGSTCKITGVVGTAGANPNDYNLTSGIGQAFSNFIIDLPNLVGKYVLTNQATLITAQFSATNLTVNSTGSSTYGTQLTSSGKQEVINVATYTQNGGIVSILHNSSNATAKALNVTGNFTLTGTSLFNISAYTTGAGVTTLSIGGNLVMASGATLQRNTFFGTGGTSNCIFNGSGVQTATFGITNGAVNYTVNNPAGMVLGGNLSTTGSLTLTSGKLTLGAYNATANTITGTSTNYVVTNGAGTLGLNIPASTGSYTFPVGYDVSTYRPATINFTVAPTAGILSARSISGFPGNTGLPLTEPAVLPNITDNISLVGDAYWEVNQVSGTGGTYDATFTGNGQVNVLDFANTTLIKRPSSAGSWAIEGTHVATTGSNAAPVLSRTGLTSFSQFGIGAPVGALPLSLISFNASLQNSQVKLFWKTENEVNVSQYMIEKSTDARTYNNIGTVAALNGSSNNYNYTDATSLAGVAYYRLKIIDRDGSFKYSNIIAVNNKKAGVLSIFPNPVNSSIFITHDKALAGAKIEVYAMDGRKVMGATATMGATQTSVNAASLPAGHYNLVFANGDNVQYIKFVKQ